MLSTPKAKSGLFLASSLCDGLEDNNIRQVATLLLNNDADPNILIPTHGVTPFHLVIGNDSIEFAEEVTKLFLRHSGDPNVRSNDGMTPVHIAAAWGRINILELLLVNGGDPLCLDNERRTPFHYAFEGKYFKAVTILAKFCENSQTVDDKPKYNIVLDKVLVINGDIVAEYITSKDTVLDIDMDSISKNTALSDYKPISSSIIVETNNVLDTCDTSKIKYEPSNTEQMKCDNIDEDNIDVKSVKHLSVANDITITQQSNLLQTDDKSILNYSFIDLDFDFANLHLSDVMQKEKSLVSKIITHLSATLSSCTINETLHNCKKIRDISSDAANCSDTSLQLKENQDASYKYDYHKNVKNVASKVKCNKDILKHGTLNIRKQCSKYRIRKISKERNKKNYDRILLSTCNMDNSLISMSPNFNMPNRRKRRNTVKTPLILSHVHNDFIISKSPNFAIPDFTNRKRHIAKSSTLDDCSSSKISKKFHKHKNQKQYLEFNWYKKHITQSTPRRKKRSINKFYSNRKRFDLYWQEDVISDEFTVFNTLKPINLNKKIFSEETEDTHHDTSDSNHELSSKLKKSSKIKQQNYNNDHWTIKLCEYEESTTHDNNYSNHMNLCNNFNLIKKEDKSIDNLDDKKLDIKLENNEINNEFITVRKDIFKIEKVPRTIDSSTPNNIRSTCITESNSSNSENFVDCVDCDTKKLLNEDLNMNISKTCNLHARSWCSNKPLSHKSTTENNSFSSIGNFCMKYNNQICLSDSQESTYSSRTYENDINPKRVGNTFKTEHLNECKSEKSSSLLSYVSTQKEYKYEDPEEGIILLERRLCFTPFSTPNESECDVEKNMAASSSFSTSTSQSLPKELLFIDDATLRRELTQFGDQPGPITSTTRRVYLKRLVHLRSIKDTKILLSAILWNNPKNYTDQNVRIKPHLEFGDWINHLDTYRSLEKHVFQEFVSPNPSRRWREGISKASFTYLLLDPRVTQDLPHRSDLLTESEIWSTFLNAIFYIGKGKRSRPFAHLYDAFKIWVSKAPTNASNKINRILDIWNNDHGVICLHIFQNIIPVEAYTREAAMIDAMGTECLGNCKNGEYYGIIATWTMQQKQKFGRYLLYKALQILLHEGERQLFPQNL